MESKFYSVFKERIPNPHTGSTYNDDQSRIVDWYCEEVGKSIPVAEYVSKTLYQLGLLTGTQAQPLLAIATKAASCVVSTNPEIGMFFQGGRETFFYTKENHARMRKLLSSVDHVLQNAPLLHEMIAWFVFAIAEETYPFSGDQISLQNLPSHISKHIPLFRSIREDPKWDVAYREYLSRDVLTDVRQDSQRESLMHAIVKALHPNVIDPKEPLKLDAEHLYGVRMGAMIQMCHNEQTIPLYLSIARDLRKYLQQHSPQMEYSPALLLSESEREEYDYLQEVTQWSPDPDTLSFERSTELLYARYLIGYLHTMRAFFRQSSEGMAIAERLSRMQPEFEKIFNVLIAQAIWTVFRSADAVFRCAALKYRGWLKPEHITQPLDVLAHPTFGFLRGIASSTGAIGHDISGALKDDKRSVPFDGKGNPFVSKKMLPFDPRRCTLRRGPKPARSYLDIKTISLIQEAGIRASLAQRCGCPMVQAGLVGDMVTDVNDLIGKHMFDEAGEGQFAKTKESLLQTLGVSRRPWRWIRL